MKYNGQPLSVKVLACECDGSGPHWGASIRFLPIGGGGNILVCRGCFQHEMNFRRERIAVGVPFDLPDWNDLRISYPHEDAA